MNEPASRIELTPVNSSMFSAIGYSDEHWTLTVQFRSNGLVLTYQDVPPEVFDDFKSAESLGRYYNDNVKGKYKAIGEEPGESIHRLMEEVSAQIAKVGEQALREHEEHAKEVAEAIATGATVNGGNSIRSPFTTTDADPTIPAEETALVTMLAGEVLGVLEPPKSPQEALALIEQQDGLIQATIAQSKEIATEALKVQVTNADTYADAGEKVLLLTGVKDRAIAFLDPIRSVLLKPYQLAQQNLKAAVDPIDEAVKNLKGQRFEWSQEQERKAEEERQRLQAEADAKAEEERKARSEQLTLAAVDEAIANGDTERAEEFIENPIEATPVYGAPVIVGSGVPKTAGLSTRKNWKAELSGPDGMELLVLDIAKGIESIRAGKGLAGHAPVTFVKLDETKVNQSAKAQEKLFSYPGLRARNDGGESVSRKAKK